MTKNRQKRGTVHLSALYMMSPDLGQRLQNTAPSIMQTRSDENEIVTGPTLKLICDRAIVMNTNAIDIASLLLFEKKSSSTFVSKSPRREPSPSERTISRSGSTIMATTFRELDSKASATPNETAKATRPTASSNATTGSSKSVTFPWALYCFTTINVAAGAVAVAIAPRVRAPDKLKV